MTLQNLEAWAAELKNAAPMFAVDRSQTSRFEMPPPKRAPFLRRLRVALGIAWTAFWGAMS